MYTVAITGGVGSGKSTATRILLELYGPSAILFDCDASVHRWLTTPEVVEVVADRFGGAILDAKGEVNRSALGKRIFSSSADREFLEELLHPLVVEEGTRHWTEARDAAEPVALFVHEIPLLYEVDSQLPYDLDVLIAASPSTQRQRLKEQRSLSDSKIDAVLASQWPMKKKVELASVVIWNDGSIEELKDQLVLLNQRIEAATKAQ